MLKRKNIAKILLLVLTLTLLLGLMTGCTGNTVIDTTKELSDWKEVEITFEEERGFFDTILFWIGTFISWITKIMPAHSYILALFIFAIVIEILMLPFSIMQQKNSRKQAKLRPKEMAIRKKYAGRNDQATQQKVTQEIQELYQKEQFNPMSGCLPLLIQLPIIMALYSIVIHPLKYVIGMGGNFVNFVSTYMKAELGVEVAKSGTIGFISDFKELVASKGVEAFEGIKDYCANGDAVYEKIGELAEITEGINLNIGPVNMGYIPSFTPSDKMLYWLLAIPVLTFLVYFFSSKITRKFTYQPTQSEANNPQAGCSNKMMDWMMPLMSVWMTFIVPAAVGIYWMFKSIVSMIKQIIISKAMPLPVFTEEDYREEERKLRTKNKGKNNAGSYKKASDGKQYRSLHHIDDEELTPKEDKTQENKPAKPAEGAPKLKDDK